ncbi:MAG: Tat pathway signal protein [Deltaproteobacteria bacterium]|nr:Tat pathway signal protein [Deltaproteobacteria bacterium]|tara:strand:- start:419 stop:2530 length:2112 start_codon:yes stop_codon:yes gene_type:complete
MSHKGKKDRFLATLPEDGFTTYDVLTADGVHNHSENRHFSEIINTYISRRKVLVGGLGLAALKLFGCVGEHTTGEPNEKDIDAASPNEQESIPEQDREQPPEKSQVRRKLGFTSIPIADLEDTVIVPNGYTATVFFAWGDPVSDGPSFKKDASNTASEQEKQAGMHHDGMHYFPLPIGSTNSKHGLLVVNHEYLDPQILHKDGGFRDNPKTYTKEKAEKEFAAHGVSVIEIKKRNEQWEIVRPSKYARRISLKTPMELRGPAASDELMKTKADPSGLSVMGTFANCANGYTPWGTYLTCEENILYSFTTGDSTQLTKKQRENAKRMGISSHTSYGWETFFDRFDMQKEPNEPNRFGWVVEIDPFDPHSKPIKRTALGRFAHENAAHTVGADGRLGFYMGDDSKFEYIYKFVTAGKFDPNNRANNKHLLDEGVLYVAKFHENGTGTWLPLVHDSNGLTKDNGFINQADVLIRARAAADQVGGTPMDRPEWISADPTHQWIYATLTNNNLRGASSRYPDKNKANPRIANAMGHIIRWKEDSNHPSSLKFTWDVYLLAGDPQASRETNRGNVKGDIFANPDGLTIDPDGYLWIQTDISGSAQNNKEYKVFGNNQMLVSDPTTGECKRFLTGPVGCEITGLALTPDLTSMWVNIQHPGDVPGGLKGKVFKTPSNPTAASTWPDGDKNGRPRSATILITKNDGGLIGS